MKEPTQLEKLENAIKMKQEELKMIEGEISGLYQAIGILKSMENHAK
jgi:hypothetical protein